jgi:hypothetical protein
MAVFNSQQALKGVSPHHHINHSAAGQKVTMIWSDDKRQTGKRGT